MTGLGDLLKTTENWLGSRGIESGRLDAELLLCEVLKLDRIQLYTSFDRPLSTPELDAYRRLVKRRGNFEPVAYILGRKEFYGRDFVVDSRVLVPRPDTEVLVDSVLEWLGDEAVDSEQTSGNDDPSLVLDYGCGSGAIGLTLAAERQALRVLAVDCSPDALDVTRENAAHLGVRDRVGFVLSDGLSAVPERFQGSLRVLVANPPYIAKSDKDSLARDIVDYEPHLALFPDEDPLEHYRRLASTGLSWLAEGGLLAMEVGQGQATDVSALLERAGWSEIAIRTDLARIRRVVSALRPPARSD